MRVGMSLVRRKVEFGRCRREAFHRKEMFVCTCYGLLSLASCIPPAQSIAIWCKRACPVIHVAA